MIGLSERVNCPQSADKTEADECERERGGENVNDSQSSWLNFCSASLLIYTAETTSMPVHTVGLKINYARCVAIQALFLDFTRSKTLRCFCSEVKVFRDQDYFFIILLDFTVDSSHLATLP